jgi:hypothetical protein
MHSQSRPIEDEGSAIKVPRLERLPGHKHTILDEFDKPTTRLKAYQLKGGQIKGNNTDRRSEIRKSAVLSNFVALDNGNATGTFRGRGVGDEEATMRKLENYLIELFPGELCVVAIVLRRYVLL